MKQEIPAAVLAALRQSARPAAGLLVLVLATAWLGFVAPASAMASINAANDDGTTVHHHAAMAGHASAGLSLESSEGKGKVDCPHCGEAEVACAAPTDCDDNPVLLPRDEQQGEPDLLPAQPAWPEQTSIPTVIMPVALDIHPPRCRLHLVHECFRE